MSLVERLKARQAEIEAAILTRVHAISDPAQVSDPSYSQGLREAVEAAVGHGFEGIEHGGRSRPSVPVELLAQARRAARNRVTLDTVLRRYFAGYALLGDFIIEEAEREGSMDGGEMQALMRAHSSVLDGLVEAVIEEYGRERETHRVSTEQHRDGRVMRLLEGGLLDTSEFTYRFDAHHLGAVATGPNAIEALYGLSSFLDSQLLAIPQGEEDVWAWLGTGRPADCDELERALNGHWPNGHLLAFGEPGKGIDGWRLTHRQARAAAPFARGDPGGVVHYATVCLLASSLQDGVLVASLQQIYLEPLSRERDGGAALRDTLRALIASGNNVSSAAAALGVKRHTVTNRLRTVEQHIGRPLSSCTAELDLALRLEALGRPISPHSALSGC